MKPDDDARRQRALDPAASFIVQAPAGSGKTELLIQRYLALLATVERPEEILAITFTRKAAAEMRDRVLASLARGRDERPPQAAHEAANWRLARDVLARDAAHGWGLSDSPSRLQVMTIDAFNALLVRRLPLVSGVGGPVNVTEDVAPLYQEAVRAVLRGAGDRTEAGALARRLLAHLDNDFELASRQLCYLLGRRDHWLPRVLAARATDEDQRREELEASLERTIEAVLSRVAPAVSAETAGEWAGLAAHAGGRLAATNPDHPLTACRGLTSLPAPSAAELPRWRALTELLLTGTGSWRRQVNKTLGFPPDDPEHKARMTALLESLRDDGELNGLLNEVRGLPPARFEDDQWKILGDLLALLPVCAGELALAFRRNGRLDYVALAQHARGALGQPDEPTDLALALDYRIRHILVDEFQDVSAAQVELLETLTAGWTDGDGRTVFCVGDPMQSIYRFREAEVALYLRTRAAGLGALQLEPLTLSSNFRSRPGLVDWCNSQFPDIFPAREDAALGAVSYASSAAARTDAPGPSVTLAGVPAGDVLAEAAAVADRIEAIRRATPGAGIAVLVRARPHLAVIAPELRRRGLRYQAVEIESLGSRQPIQDLLALTRAVSHLGDRTAWLAVLRAPWCGLRLVDLETLAGGPETTLWSRLCDDTVLARLTDDGRRRAVAARRSLRAALAQRGRRPLHRLVEGSWLSLGGPATVPDVAALADARQFFRLLAGLETAGDLADQEALESRLDALYAAPEPDADGGLQLMTIHKAKGLEFDHVILPGLDRRPRGSVRPLLYWHETIPTEGHSNLLLAPVEPRGADPDRLQTYIAGLEKRRNEYELQRLLYVAATRAREQLHLVTPLPQQDDDGRYRMPVAGSLLALLWPRLGNALVAAAVPASEGNGDARPPSLRRLTAGWRSPEPPPDALAGEAPEGLEEPAETEEGIEFDWAGEVVRVVGTVTHRYLERIAAEGVDRWDPARLAAEASRMETMVAEAGVPAARREAAANQVRMALANTLADERGRWILAARDEAARSEFGVAGVAAGRVVRRRIDRCFLDDGVRWIVDFKVSPHEGLDLDAFVAAQTRRYRPQLEEYARLLAALYPHERDRRVALYFTLQGRLEAWTPGSG
jgi:ATP-dependent helicase/nuclease subunit A